MENIKDTKILVVDDAKTIRQMVKGFLNDLGIHSITEAEDGKQALSILKQTTVDLVICDWYMPEMSGIELIRSVRAKDPLTAPPFIMITTEKQCDAVKEAMAFGVDEYLVKPFSANQLFDKVKRVVTRKQKLRHSLQNLSLLLVDDSKSVRLLLHQMLDNLGADKIIEAESVDASWELLKEHDDVDVVVCDWNMPGTNGLEFLEMLRSNKTTDHMAYVRISSESKEDKVKTAVKSGVDEYLMKPFQPSEISKKILRATQRRKSSLTKNFRR